MWRALKLGDTPDARPLYVGKAEDSLVARDLKTHFRDGRTGQSPLRRSLAALLRRELRLHAIPRNPAKPSRFSNYGLSPKDDSKLTHWMETNLELAVWVRRGRRELAELEAAVCGKLRPPLNLRGVETPWKQMVQRERKVMAKEARRWASE